MSIYEYDEEKHMRQEREASLEEGKRIGIKAMIEENLEEGKTRDVIIGKLMKWFELELQEAESYFQEYGV